jgi:zincin-like metallopeptidase toxin 3 of polymorphic toxin system
MFFAQDDMQKYPRCMVLLQALEGATRATPRVFSAFLDACTADDQPDHTGAAARIIAENRALRLATGPRIIIHEGLIKGKSIVGPQDECGRQRFGVIEITSIWFNAFEFCTPVDRDKNSSRLTRTILHECVHWVREEANASDDINLGFKLPPAEAGKFFEDRAYGTRSVCNTDDILDALASITSVGERQISTWRNAKSTP